MRKIFTAILLVIVGIASSGLMVSSAYAMPFGGPFHIKGLGLGPALMNPYLNVAVQRSWVRLNGIITQWGSTPVNGSLWAQARAMNVNDTVREWAGAKTVWSTQPPPINSVARPRGNFTHTFYGAGLLRLSKAKLGSQSDDYNFFMNGTWNFCTVTITNTIITNDDGDVISRSYTQNVVPITAYGELKVTDNWTKFTLAINGVDALKGSLRRSMIRPMWINPFKVSDDGIDRVTKQDFMAVAKNYGAMLGFGNYIQEMDFNFDYKIDIADLTTVAANIQ